MGQKLFTIFLKFMSNYKHSKTFSICKFCLKNEMVWRFYNLFPKIMLLLHHHKVFLPSDTWRKWLPFKSSKNWYLFLLYLLLIFATKLMKRYTLSLLPSLKSYHVTQYQHLKPFYNKMPVVSMWAKAPNKTIPNPQNNDQTPGF